VKVGAEESGSEFRYELLDRIGPVAEAIAELAIAAALVARLVDRLMIDEPAPRIPLLLKDSGASQTIPSSRHRLQRATMQRHVGLCFRSGGTADIN
jgi:hypothetical protein